MAAVDIMLEMAEPAPAVPRRVPLRFERVAITSIWGDPLAPGTWSGAPANLAAALPAGAKVVSTAVGDGRIVLTLDVSGAIELMTFDAQTLKPLGHLRLSAAP